MVLFQPDNDELALLLDRIADLLAVHDTNPHRVRAWRNAADTVRGHGESVADLWRRAGEKGLEELPGIGEGIAGALGEYLATGRLRQLERLEGEVGPEDLFATVPGVGPTLAKRIRAGLDVSTLEELEVAAHDGRLARLPGIGARRLRGIQNSLATMLSRNARVRARRRLLFEEQGERPAEPPVELVLAIDAQYRRRAEAGELPCIAPRRFNPSGEAWLPILRGERDGWSYTALYSNTALAHELGTTRDWVVVYFRRDAGELVHTVVTCSSGPLAGQRVVRGRESECLTAAERDGSRGSGSALPPTAGRSSRESPGSPTRG